MDPRSAVVGAGLLLSGVLLSRFIFRTAGPQDHGTAVQRSHPRLICSCGHMASFHDRRSKRCLGETSRAFWLNGFRSPLRYEHAGCRCQWYDGPYRELTPDEASRFMPYLPSVTPDSRT